MNLPHDLVARKDQIKAEAKRLVRHSPCFLLTALDVEAGTVKTCWYSPTEVPDLTRAVHEFAMRQAAKVLDELDERQNEEN